MVNYAALEQSLYTQLTPIAAAGLRVRFLPELVAEIGDPAGNGWITMMLEQETLDRNALNEATAEVQLQYSVEVVTRSLRSGNVSYYGAMNFLRAYLWGFIPTGAIAPIMMMPFQRANPMHDYWVHRGGFMVRVFAGISQAGIINDPIKDDGLTTLILDSDYDTDINLPLP